MNYEPKPIFIERMSSLLNDKNDLDKFFLFCKTKPKKSLRVNTLKISPENLLRIFKEKSWRVSQIKNYSEIIQIESQLLPGELGRAIEHILGYYYIQEITSMMPIIALNPKAGELVLDLCASPGSKTTQAAALMNNKGTIIANDLSLSRVSILSANLERIGVTNTIITRHDGVEFSRKIKKIIKNNFKVDSLRDFKFDKILFDAPCSGEGNIRLSPRTLLEWSENLVKNFGRKQKNLIQSAFDLLKINGEMVYSTCTHSPEENEEIIQYLLENNNVEIMPINLPLKTRPGILEWQGKKFHPSLTNAVRIYHHDNDLE
jgi:NOL1/NOP2/sun family putative RNA methylase